MKLSSTVLQSFAIGASTAVLLAAGFSGAAQAAARKAGAAKPTTANSTLPPLLDRELFFGNPEIAGAQLSPDGKYIAFLRPWKDTRNVWVKKRGEGYDKAHLITADAKRPIPGFFWSRDSRFVLFVQDHDGDENYNIYAVDPAAKPADGQEAPAARNITDAKGARAILYELPKNDPDVIMVGLNDREAAWHDVYKVKISTGERTLVRKNTDRIASWDFDLSGKLRLAERTKDNGDTEILRVDEAGFTPVYSCSVFESCGVDRFHKDGARVYMETNKGESDLIQLVLFDPATGKEELVESDPDKRVDLDGTTFSQATDELVGTSYESDRRRYYFREPGFAADYKLLQEKLPGKDVSMDSLTADDQLAIVTASSDTDPGTRYIFDRKTKALALEYKVRERIPREHMAEMKPVHYLSSDGLDIPAYLTLPKGVAPKNLPALIMPHGGPWARDHWGFGGYPQFMANRGYAVLQANYRGSIGYGKKFSNAGNRQWGEKMQDDLTWGAKYLVAQGIADPKRIGIMGGSYGGYATLAGLAFTPDLYAAGVSIVGPSNLITMLDSFPPYWESGRIIFYERVGNPKTPEGRKQLAAQSPLNSADKIKTPLLVAQGANDPRVKRAESEQIVVALRDRGFPVEYIVAPDEGHGFARPVNSMAFFTATEAFLAKHLGGRFQEGGTPEVVARLKEITVDPKTVQLAKKADPAAVTAPKPAADLTPASFTYQGTFARGEQTAPLSLSRSIKEDAGHWIVADTVKLPMGEQLDTTVLDKGTLLASKRTLKAGPVEIEVNFKDGKATGSMSMGGQTRPIDVDMGGPVFGEGAGSHEAVAHLPLAEGYATSFRTFDLQQQKASLKQVKVVGAEDVSVAAGKFKTWKVEVSSAEGEPGVTTLWVASDSRKIVKAAATLPNATITSELQP